jgi:ubiquinone/menaquinone biosynthesis C-methylase UbiE
MRDPAAAAAVDAHYGRSGPMRLLGAAIHDAVGTEGPVDPEALEPYEEFHVGARPATLRLVELVQPTEGMRVLDVGAGVGGPARLLARRYGCRVTALDLTEEFCRLAEELTARTGLSEAVAVVQGDALDMPFPDAAFDLIWTQHASMNIADRERLYAGMRRVCAPDGRLALYDVLAGPNAPPRYPLPWADEPSISSLRTAEEQRALVVAAGFRELVWEDATAEGLEGFKQMQLAGAGATPPGMRALVEDLMPKMKNLAAGLEAGTLALGRGVFAAA